MTIYAVQYLEYLPQEATPAAVQKRLREACTRLPITMVLLGWELPEAIEQAVADEASRLNLRLFRWQPWLTGDSGTEFPPEWAVRGLDGAYIPGHKQLPEFTFACPNRSGVTDFLSERLESIAARGLYQGLFLDRIRFPSPTADPATHLGCFCSTCTRLAADRGLDLREVQLRLQGLLSTPYRALSLACGLLDPYEPGTQALQDLLTFRLESINRTVEVAYRQAAAHHLALGLDCFSPTLSPMVGQDLSSLNAFCEWIKLMIYPRVWGPAGLSFELLALANWLIQQYSLNEKDVFAELSRASELPLPAHRSALRKKGLDSSVIALEIQRGRDLYITKLLAGIALVDLPGIHHATPAQIQSDLHACQSADGLVLSWDLWHIPFSVLDSIH
jgi:hypothetical protein